MLATPHQHLDRRMMVLLVGQPHGHGIGWPHHREVPAVMRGLPGDGDAQHRDPSSYRGTGAEAPSEGLRVLWGELGGGGQLWGW